MHERGGDTPCLTCFLFWANNRPHWAAASFASPSFRLQCLACCNPHYHHRHSCHQFGSCHSWERQRISVLRRPGSRGTEDLRGSPVRGRCRIHELHPTEMHRSAPTASTRIMNLLHAVAPSTLTLVAAGMLLRWASSCRPILTDERCEVTG
jgi:hypothetical protein